MWTRVADWIEGANGEQRAKEKKKKTVTLHRCVFLDLPHFFAGGIWLGLLLDVTMCWATTFAGVLYVLHVFTSSFYQYHHVFETHNMCLVDFVLPGTLRALIRSSSDSKL